MAAASLLLSGGLDSVVLIHWALREGYELQALFFDYGQDALRGELFCARVTTKNLKIPLEVFDISGLRRNFLGLTGYDYRMISTRGTLGPEPNGKPCEDKALALGIAAEYTVLTNRQSLLTGAIVEDTKATPEMQEFLNAFSLSIRHLYARTGQRFSIEAPFLKKSKAEVVRLGQTLHVNWAHTWSCEASGRVACRKCSGCKERTDAFTAAGVEDLLDRRVQ